jgi:hypothetical protein
MYIYTYIYYIYVYTGLRIFLIDALRSVGIPARLVGTPAWNNDPRNGNHNWVEVWVDSISEWQFIQAEPAGGGTFSGKRYIHTVYTYMYMYEYIYIYIFIHINIYIYIYIYT